MLIRRKVVNAINQKLDHISIIMERNKIMDYVYYLENPRKMFMANFIGGLARGFGAAIGFTVLAAAVIYILQIVVKWQLPVIGEFISEIVKIVQYNVKNAGGS